MRRVDPTIAEKPSGARVRHCRTVPARARRQVAWATVVLAMLTVALGFAPEAGAQPRRFTRISLEQGLSQSIIEQAIQDRLGFMWFATEDGLNRFDGYRFVVYKNVPGEPESLSHNELKSVYEDRSGTLWVGAFEGGLNRFDPATEKAIRYRHDPADPTSLADDTVRAILEDREGNLWVGTQGGGLDRFDRKTGRFFHHRADPVADGMLRSDDIRAILEDRSGALWIGTNGGGLARLDRATGRFTSFRNDSTDSGSLAHDAVFALVEDAGGALWVGTYGGGLDRFDRASGRFVHHRARPSDPTTLPDDRIKALCEDALGALWVGTDGGGVARYDQDRGVFSRLRNDPLDRESLSTDRVYSLVHDRSNVLWVGTYGGGLNTLDVARKPFGHVRNVPGVEGTLNDRIVWTFCEDRHGVLWVGTDSGGLNRRDPETGRWSAYLNQPGVPTSLSANTVRVVREDRSGTLWVATHGGGLDRLDRATGRFTHFRHDPADPSSLAHDELRSLEQDSAGALWVGTFGAGLDRFDPATGKFTHFRHRPDDPSSLSNDFIRLTLEDREGALWVGTQGGGLNRLDPRTGRCVRYRQDPKDDSSLSNDYVFALLETRGGEFWVGTFGGGLNRMDRERGTFERFTVRDGLPSNSLYALLEDERGGIWISSTNGLSRFDPKTRTFRNYDVSDGLQSNEFNGGSAYLARDGEMYFGGINGFNVFRPGSIGSNPEPPGVVITDLRLFNRSVAVGEAVRGRVVLPRSISVTRSIELSYRENVFSLEFAALHYSAPAKNRFAYSMEGFDTAWIPVGADLRLATFTGLGPGHYVFRVRAANCDGVWNEEGVALAVTITPPFWATWPFRIAMIGLFASVLAAGFRGHLRGVRMRTQLAAAHDAQMAIMPQHPPAVPGYEIDGVCIPASEVGGDFFDYFWLAGEPRRLGIVVGDVAGKAMPAAMTAVMSDGMATAWAGWEGSVEEIADGLNRSLGAKVGKHMFTALCLVALDPERGELTFVNAGLCEPLHRSAGDVTELVSEGPSVPLGVFPDTGYRSRAVRLSPGDVVVIFSDGVPEARRGDDEVYGYEAPRGWLARLPIAGMSARRIAEALVEDVRRFAGPAGQSDDMTVVVIRVLP